MQWPREINASDFPRNRTLTGTPLNVPPLRGMSYERKWRMRNLTQPPPSMRCEHCNGELRFKRIEPDDPVFDMEVEIFVCAKCGHAHSFPVIHDPYAAHTASKYAAR